MAVAELTMVYGIEIMDWFRGKFTGKPDILSEKQWFPVHFPFNQSIDIIYLVSHPTNPR